MRPRCEKCGKRIYRIQRILRLPIPAYCPSCGAEIRFHQRNDLRVYETIVCTVIFTICAIVMMTLIQLGFF